MKKGNGKAFALPFFCCRKLLVNVIKLIKMFDL